MQSSASLNNPFLCTLCPNLIELKIFSTTSSYFLTGLDTKHDQTGKYSLYKKFNDLEIMFHVGPLLPYRYKKN